MLNRLTNRLRYKAFSYVEVLVAMVIISGVFTAFISLAYQSVHRAKILEQKDLMENYAIGLIESFTDAVANNTEIWTTPISVFRLEKEEGRKLLVPAQTCKFVENDNDFLTPYCGKISDVLDVKQDTFYHFIKIQHITRNVIKATIVVGCMKTQDGTITCNGKELKPIKLERFVVNYGQTK